MSTSHGPMPVSSCVRDLLTSISPPRAPRSGSTHSLSARARAARPCGSSPSRAPPPTVRAAHPCVCCSKMREARSGWVARARELASHGGDALLAEALRLCDGWPSPVAALLAATAPSDVTGYPIFDRDVSGGPLFSHAAASFGADGGEDSGDASAGPQVPAPP
eukprot:7207220-Prymnesium_polylepis.1